MTGAGPVWVDGAAYCRARLLGGDAIPWTDPGRLASFAGQSAALLGTDALLVDVGQAWQVRAADPELAAAMARQTRRARPLRTLLEDGAARALAAEALRTTAAGARVPIVAVLPSPAQWIRQAGTLAGLPDEPPDESTVDAAAMYAATALDVLDGLPAATVLIDAGPDGPADLPEPDQYRPLLNAAAHLRLPVVVRTDGAPCWPHGAVDGVSAWIGAAPPPAREDGAWSLAQDLSAALPPSTGGAPRLVRIPPTADPDTVTATIRSWDRLATAH